MNMLTVVRIVAVVCTGLLAGIFLGYRAGPQYAVKEIGPSSFVQFQQVVHVHFVRFMPPLVLTTLLSALAWLLMVRSQWRSAEFWLILASTCGIVLIAALTRAVSVPLNNQLMTWNIATPPHNVWEIWAPWDRVNTIRALVATSALVLEVVTLSLRASSGRL
jgi:uncharacterized membrane protein